MLTVTMLIKSHIKLPIISSQVFGNSINSLI